MVKCERNQGRVTREKGEGWQRSLKNSGLDEYFSEETIPNETEPTHHRSGFEEESNRHRRGGFEEESNRHRRGGFEEESNRHRRGGSEEESNRHRRGGFEEESNRHRRGGSEEESNRHRRGGSEEESNRHRRGGSEEESNRHRRGGSEEESNRHRRGVRSSKTERRTEERDSSDDISYDANFLPLERPTKGKSKQRPEHHTSTVKPDDQFRTYDTEPWDTVSSWLRDPNDENLEEMRIELRKREVRPGEAVKGRVFFDLKKTTTISNLEVLGKNVLAMSNLNSKPQIFKKEKPFYIEWAEDIASKVTLPKGANAIPFALWLRDDLSPSFIYVTGGSKRVVRNLYSVEAKARVGRDAKTTAGAAVKVLAVAGKINVSSINAEGNLLVANKYITDNDGFDYSYFYYRNQEPSDFRAFIICKVRSNKTNFDFSEEKVVRVLSNPKEYKGLANPVFDKIPDNDKVIETVESSDWDASRYSTDIKINSAVPTVSKGDFICQYFLRVEMDDQPSQEIEVIKVDEYKKK
ncbi:hypothetical protein Aperf_G00000062699 [Anoplocephala perfoliata]